MARQHGSRFAADDDSIELADTDSDSDSMASGPPSESQYSPRPHRRANAPPIRARDRSPDYAPEPLPAASRVLHAARNPHLDADDGKRHRFYLFTWFNKPYSEAVTHFDALMTAGKVTYACFQSERCPESGRYHLQGWCAFRGARTFSAAKVLISQTAHIEPARGNAEQCDKYCTKDESATDEAKAGLERYQKGERPLGQGSRSDLHNVCEKVLKGVPLIDLCNDIDTAPTMVKYHRGIEYLACHRDSPPSPYGHGLLYLLYGAPGSGKTYASTKLILPDHSRFNPPITSGDGKIWFDGYNREPIIVFNDVTAIDPQQPMGNRATIFAELVKNLCDPIDLALPIKGGTVHKVRIWATIINGCDHPKTWFPSNQWSQILSRCSLLAKFKRTCAPCSDRYCTHERTLEVERDALPAELRFIQPPSD